MTDYSMKHSRIKIYVASPLGFSEVGRDFLYSRIIPVIEELEYEVLDPWKLTPEEIMQPVTDMPYGNRRKNRLKKINKIIGENNAKAIDECSGMLAVLDGTDVDSGTASEIGYAVAKGKRVLGYRGDFRMASDNEGSIVNLQVEYFIEKSGGKIITEIKNLKPELKKLFG